MNQPSETVLLEDVNAALKRFIHSFASIPTSGNLDANLPLLMQTAETLRVLEGKRVGLNEQKQLHQLRRNLDTVRALLHQSAELYRSLGREGNTSPNGYYGFTVPESSTWHDPTVVVES